MMASVNQNVGGTYQAPVNNQPEPGTIFNHQQPQANTEVAIASSNTSEEVLDTNEETDTKEEVKTKREEAQPDNKNEQNVVGNKRYVSWKRETESKN